MHPTFFVFVSYIFFDIWLQKWISAGLSYTNFHRNCSSLFLLVLVWPTTQWTLDSEEPQIQRSLKVRLRCSGPNLLVSSSYSLLYLSPPTLCGYFFASPSQRSAQETSTLVTCRLTGAQLGENWPSMASHTPFLVLWVCYRHQILHLHLYKQWKHWKSQMCHSENRIL